MIKNDPGELRHYAAHVVKAGFVYRLRAVLFSHADDRHLHQAALGRAAESGVGLDAPAQDHTVGLVGIFVDVDRAPLHGVAQIHSFHGGLDGAAHGLLGHIVTFQHIQLAGHRGAAVAAHGGEHERLGAALFYKVHDGLYNNGNVGDAAAAAGNANAHARLDVLPHCLAQKLPAHHGGQVCGFDVGGIKALAHPHHFWQLYGGAQLLCYIVLFALKCHCISLLLSLTPLRPPSTLAAAAEMRAKNHKGPPGAALCGRTGWETRRV